MIVTMVSMLVMQAAVDEVVDVVAMRHGFMAAAGAVNMAMVMPGVIANRLAPIRVRGAHFDNMLVDMVTMWVMQVAIMQIVDMFAVLHSRVAAAGAVRMVVVFVMGEMAVAHGVSFPFSGVRKRDRRHC
jgi:hypothetical protein